MTPDEQTQENVQALAQDAHLRTCAILRELDANLAALDTNRKNARALTHIKTTLRWISSNLDIPTIRPLISSLEYDDVIFACLASGLFSETVLN